VIAHEIGTHHTSLRRALTAAGVDDVQG